VNQLRLRWSTAIGIVFLIAGASAVEPQSPQRTDSGLDEAREARKAGDLDRYERTLREAAASEDPVNASRALALHALHLFDQKRFDEAVPALRIAAERSPLVAPFLRLREIEAELSRGNLDAAVAAANIILETAPETTAATIARLKLPALHAAAGNKEATAAAFTVASTITIDELTEREFVELAALLDDHGRHDLGARLRMRLLRDYTGGRFTEETYGHLTRRDPSPLDQLSLDEATTVAQSLARANRYDQAIDLLARIRRRFPKADRSDLYRSVRLRSLFNSRRYEQLLAETSPRKLDDPALLLLRARAAWRDDRPEEFLAGLADLERRFPRSAQAAEAKIQRAKYYVTDVTDYEKSVADLRDAIAAGAAGTDGVNLWTLGWTYTLWGKDDEALQTFQQYLARYPDGDYRTNALFWSGKIHQRNGRTAERDAALQQLLAEYPYNYFSYRAREILGLPALAPNSVANGFVFPDLEADLEQIDARRIAVVRELMAIDLAGDAGREMKAIASGAAGNRGAAFLLADVYAQSGEPFRAAGILQREFRDFVRRGGENVPRRFWEILYPLQYWETIQREAGRRELDPYLVASIIRQESGFEPTTVSNAGAVGLMQIMPNEAARIASAAGLDTLTREELFDPHENIAVGAAEFAQKLAAMEGNPILAIAAYNAGEQAVGRWIARTPIGDPDLFVESISYAETRLYVKTVTRNRFEYRRIYESSTSQPQSQ
jgi:soluble lytic murein transglycosylase